MSTRNFYTCNANNVYSFGEDAEDSFDFDVCLNAIKDIAIYKYGFEETSGCDDNRSYTGSYILEKWLGAKEFYNSGLDTNINVIIVARDGYYAGANLDFELEIENEYDEPKKLGDYRNVDDLIDDMADVFVDDYYDLYNYGLRKCFKNRYKAFLEHNIYEAIDYANDILSKLCDGEYRLIGTFSNGEGIYEKVR